MVVWSSAAVYEPLDFMYILYVCVLIISISADCFHLKLLSRAISLCYTIQAGCTPYNINYYDVQHRS